MLADFTDVKRLDSFSSQTLEVMACVQDAKFTGPVWLGETSTTYDGGTEGLSDSYVAGFMYVSFDMFFLSDFICACSGVWYALVHSKGHSVIHFCCQNSIFLRAVGRKCLCQWPSKPHPLTHPVFTGFTQIMQNARFRKGSARYSTYVPLHHH